jgi:hypothetical protein
MAINVEPTYVEPIPCCCCDDPAHTRPGWHGWEATDTEHPGVSAVSDESPERAIKSLAEAIAYRAKFMSTSDADG